MATLELKGDPKKEYAKANPAGKKLLEKLYGAEAFKPSIIEQVNSMADVYRLAGVNPKDYVIKANMSKRVKRRIYGEKLELIEEVLNQGVPPDMKDTSKYKYYPWFKWNGTGFGFSHSDCGATFTDASLGSRFASRELAEHAGRKFTKEYNDFIMSTSY